MNSFLYDKLLLNGIPHVKLSIEDTIFMDVDFLLKEHPTYYNEYIHSDFIFRNKLLWTIVIFSLL
jgi:hypothetical protein